MNSTAHPFAARQEITFVLSDLPDLNTLLSGLPIGSEVHVLDAGGDALAQMASLLEGRSGIDAIHLMSHGGPGSLSLGQTTLSGATLEQHGDTLASIGSALSDAADLLIYGCNVGAGETGQQFVQALSAATGADVAASEDLTGAAHQGGDWILETHAGIIESGTLALENVDGVLASGIFNNGYIKFGYSDDGTFGYGGNTAPGIFYDSTGGFSYPSNADFLTPGTPREFFTLQSSGGTWTNKNDSYTAPQMATTRTESITSSGGKTYGTLTFTSTAGGLELKQTITLGANSQVITIDVSIRNTTASTISNVKYARGLDPDVDSPLGTTNTINARGAGDIAATDIVLGTGPISGRVIGLYTNSSVTHNTHISSGWSVDPSALLGTSSNSTADSTINLAFDLGSLGAGVTKTFSFAYVYAASAAALSASITEVPASNPAPTFTSFSGALGTVLEDNPIEITYAQLAALGNEADLNANGSAGAISAFVIKAVSSGTLKIGASAETATNWSPNSNDAIPSDGSKKLFWTPAANANGALNAFTAIVRDAEGAVSASPVQATVNVTAVNDNPVIASHTTPVALPAINEDAGSIGGATVTSLFAPRFTDVDSGASLGGIIIVANTNAAGGTWQYSTDNGTNWYDIGVVATDNGLALSAASKLRFNPEANWFGTPTALSVYLTDNAYSGGYTSGNTRDTETSLSVSGISANSVNLGTTVNSVNDLPYFTSDVGAASLTETAAYDGSVTTASGSLTGTLAGNDVEDGTALAFGIRGGSVSGGTVTKAGFYGTLTLNTTSKEWTYTPDKFVNINALHADQTATDVFEFSATDTAGATVVQALTITYTGTNDTPLLSAAIADTEFNGNGAWSFQIPASTFTDAEGTQLTYTIQIVENADGTGAVLDTITGVTQNDNANLHSNWLIFDQVSRTLSGTPTITAPLPLNIKVTASDGSASVSDTFTVTLNAPASGAVAQPNAAYTENAAAVTLNPGLTVTDAPPVSEDNSSLTVTISAGTKVAGDVLAFTNTHGATFGNIAGVYDSGTGVLTLQSTGNTATLVQWSAALNAVTFHSSSDNPGPSRTLNWSSPATETTITVTEVNDAPVATKLANQTSNTGVAWSYDIDGEGNNLFTDPEGQEITYSATLADGSALPSWLTFNAVSHTFSGNPPAGVPYLNIKVIGTDASNAAGETTFTLHLTDAPNGAGATNSAASITISDSNGGSVALNDVLTANAPTDGDGYTPANVIYQWQVSGDGGATWTDISGARGQSQNLTVTQAESSKQVRVQAFYSDDGGFAEAPVSNALTVPSLNVAGVVTVQGSPTPGQTLVAALSDGNGIVGVTPT